MVIMPRGVALAFAAAVCTGVLAGCNNGSDKTGQSGNTAGNAIATVNNQPISEAEFNLKCQSYVPRGEGGGTVGRIVLAQLIRNKIVDELAVTKKVAPTQQQIDAYFQTYKMQQEKASTKTFDQQLSESGMTVDNIKEYVLKPQLEQINLFTNGSQVSDSEIKAFYDQHKDDSFTTPDAAHIKIIIVSSKPDAMKIYDQIQKAKPFEDFLGQSLNRSTPDGDIPQWIPYKNSKSTNPGEKELGAAIEKTEPGKVAQPFPIGQGYAILKVLEKRTKTVYSLDQVKDTIRMGLLEQKANSDFNQSTKASQEIQDAISRADIKVNAPQYQPLVAQLKMPPPPMPTMQAPPPAANGAPNPGASPAPSAASAPKTETKASH